MGTKMTVRRYSPVTLDWESQEIIVDEEFINANGLIIPIEYPFKPGIGILEVYLNGQLLLSGGGYEENMDNTIKLDLGIDEEGSPRQLEAGDEIYIKVHRNQFESRGGSNVSGTEVFEIKRKLTDFQRYLDVDGYTLLTTTITDRFEELRKAFEHSEFGDYDITYEYNDIGKIKTEKVTKGDGSVRTFTYNTSTGKIESEKYEVDGIALTKTYTYNASGKIEKVKVRNV